MLTLRTMTAADIPLGMRLKAQAGWNQTEADWRRVLALEPRGCFVAEWAGQAMGTTATTVFGETGWIAMVLVDESHRGRGIGTKLVQQAMQYLAQCGVQTARLDATPLGRPVYEKLGFVAEYELARWEGTAMTGEIAEGVRPAAAGERDAIAAIDRQATGTDRVRLLERLCQEQPAEMRVLIEDGRIAGYSCLRYGSRAVQLGPIVACAEAAGRELADTEFAHLAGKNVFVDIPCDNRPATRWAESRGLRVQRPLVRMRRGPPVADQPGQLWASFGPEKG